LSELDHLTEEEVKTVLGIFPRSESIIDGKTELSSKDGTSMEITTPNPEVDKSKVIELNKNIDKLQNEEWKDGYTDYEKKTKESDHLTFGETEIEISEEDLD